MRIVLEFPDAARPAPPVHFAMRTFDDAGLAVQYMHRQMAQGDKRPGVILTRHGAEEFLRLYWSEIANLPFQLMREIHPMDDDANEDGSLNYTSIEPNEIETIHEGQPCGAEIREFVAEYECWQLWMR